MGFLSVCWWCSTAGKSCTRCTSFRSVCIESAADAEFERLVEKNDKKIDVNTFFCSTCTHFCGCTIVDYKSHITTAFIYHTCAFDLNEGVFFFVFFFKTVFVLYLRSVPVISVITYCAHFLAFLCQWCYIETFCLYKIDKLSFYCHLSRCLFISCGCVFD